MAQLIFTTLFLIPHYLFLIILWYTEVDKYSQQKNFN